MKTSHLKLTIIYTLENYNFSLSTFKFFAQSKMLLRVLTQFPNLWYDRDAIRMQEFRSLFKCQFYDHCCS